MLALDQYSGPGAKSAYGSPLLLSGSRSAEMGSRSVLRNGSWIVVNSSRARHLDGPWAAKGRPRGGK